MIHALSRIVRPDDAAVEAWRNGSGATRTMLTRPGWRISIAQIDGERPFSRWDGVDRVLTPLSGGLRMRIAGDERRILPGETVRFAGEDEVVAGSPGQRLSVLNVMASRAEARIEMDVAAHAGSLEIDADAIVVLTGALHVAGRLMPAGTLMLPGPDPLRIECPFALLARIRVHRS